MPGLACTPPVASRAVSSQLNSPPGVLPVAMAAPRPAFVGFKCVPALLVLLFALLGRPADATARLPVSTAAAGLRALQQSVSGPCVCTFDFHDTLRVYTAGDKPANDADGLIQACLVSLACCWQWFREGGMLFMLAAKYVTLAGNIQHEEGINIGQRACMINEWRHGWNQHQQPCPWPASRSIRISGTAIQE